MMPDTVPEFATDKTKLVVPCPETTKAPAPIPVPETNHPLQVC